MKKWIPQQQGESFTLDKPFPCEFQRWENGFVLKVYENRLQHLSAIVDLVLKLVTEETQLAQRERHYFVLNELISNKMEHGNLEIDLDRFDPGYPELVRARESQPELVRRRLEIQVEIGEGWITYQVEDEGVGFAVQQLEARLGSKEPVKGLVLVAAQVVELNFSPSGNGVQVKIVR